MGVKKMKKDEGKHWDEKKPRGGLRKLVMGVAIAGALTLAGCVTYGNLNLSKNPTIPKGFENYRERGKKVEETDFMYFGMYVHNIGYDLDGDGQMDAGELYINPVKEGDEPFMYGFDVNENGSFQADEVYMDEEMDGINGNELRLDDFNRKNAKYALDSSEEDGLVIPEEKENCGCGMESCFKYQIKTEEGIIETCTCNDPIGKIA